MFIYCLKNWRGAGSIMDVERGDAYRQSEKGGSSSCLCRCEIIVQREEEEFFEPCNKVVCRVVLGPRSTRVGSHPATAAKKRRKDVMRSDNDVDLRAAFSRI